MSAREPIAPQLGGGFIVTGACGRPHLRGPSWSWWRCKPCRRAESAATLRDVEEIRLSLYYPQTPWEPTCGVPSFGASAKRHERAAQDCPVCREGYRDERSKVARV